MGIGIAELAVIFFTGFVGIAAVVCWIMVVVAAFQKEPTPLLGILCLVFGFLTLGLGTFVIGWVKARQWRIVPTMCVWSVLFLIPVALALLVPVSTTSGPVPAGP